MQDYINLDSAITPNHNYLRLFKIKAVCFFNPLADFW